MAAVATVGIAGGVFAAEQAAEPGDGELEQTISNQRIGDARLVRGGPVSEHQLAPFSPDQMIQLAEKYRLEMKAAIDHIEHLRIEAYKSRDLIRMTCVDDKLTQTGTVVKMAEPKALTLARETEAFPMRAHFSLVQLARERVGELVADAEGCMGEDFGAAPVGKVNEQGMPDTTNAVGDPTAAPSPIREIDRPGEASPYR